MTMLSLIQRVNGDVKGTIVILIKNFETNYFDRTILKYFSAFGYELKNGEIKMKDLSQDSVEFMDRKFVFTNDVIEFLTKVFRACEWKKLHVSACECM